MKQRTIKYGNECWILHTDGLIERPGMNGPSGQWKIIGAIEYNNFGNVKRTYSLSEILESPETIPWKFKNGKQKVFIRDCDHGTERQWGKPNHSVF